MQWHRREILSLTMLEGGEPGAFTALFSWFREGKGVILRSQWTKSLRWWCKSREWDGGG